MVEVKTAKEKISERQFTSGVRLLSINEAQALVYRSQEKSITPRELQFFQIPRTIVMDDSWLEIRNSEAVHRWRWRAVDKIGLTSDFVFIQVGTCPVVFV